VSAIELTGVGKRYRQHDEEPLLVKRLLRPHRRRAARDLWALREVTFAARAGETVGVIGRNGSGKTTLLRLLSGVSGPTEGRVRVTGTIAPLIGIGVGFNPELTGRENVTVNARLLGMSAEEIASRYDEIVAFSEIEAFIDTPVKFYSSGMYLRLAFSVAIHTDPDIFLLDELLAVGDLAFQLKCAERMHEIQDRGATIVVVTHNLQVLTRLAPRVIVLDAGGVAFDGEVEEGIGIYHALLQRDTEARTEAGRQEAALQTEGGGAVWAGTARVDVALVDDAGASTRHFPHGGTIGVRLRVELDEPTTDPVLGCAVRAQGREVVFATFTLPGEYEGTHGPDHPLEAAIDLRNHLGEGSFEVRAEVRDRGGQVVLGASDWELFAVSSTDRAIGVVNLAPSFAIDGRPLDLVQHRRLGQEPTEEG
jgi:ABC-type polysaccharide/polyol phosphate transport system ATPase subunit